MNRVVVVAVAVVAAAAGFVAGGVWSPGAAPPPPSATPPPTATTTTTATQIERELASCRDERRDLERLVARAATATATTAAAATTTATKRANEPTAAPDDARTGAWIEHVAGDLALSRRQRAGLADIVKWATDERSALSQRAVEDQLDSESVRAEIAKQREEYEKRLKALLTADEWLAFDAVQGVERRPPTFARLPDILGEKAQPLKAQARKDAGG